MDFNKLADEIERLRDDDKADDAEAVQALQAAQVRAARLYRKLADDGRAGFDVQWASPALTGSLVTDDRLWLLAWNAIRLVTLPAAADPPAAVRTAHKQTTAGSVATYRPMTWRRQAERDIEVMRTLATLAGDAIIKRFDALDPQEQHAARARGGVTTIRLAVSRWKKMLAAAGVDVAALGIGNVDATRIAILVGASTDGTIKQVDEAVQRFVMRRKVAPVGDGKDLGRDATGRDDGRTPRWFAENTRPPITSGELRKAAERGKITRRKRSPGAKSYVYSEASARSYWPDRFPRKA